MEMLTVILTAQNKHRASGDQVRILFLHAALDHLTAEYKVHKVLAEHAVAYGIESHFIWQQGAVATNDNAITIPWPERLHYIDFGRDLSTTQKYTRQQRALLMLQRLPSAYLAIATKVQHIKPDLLYTSQQRYDLRLARIMARLFHIPHVIHIHYSVGPWLGGDVVHAIRQSQYLIAISQFIRQTALLQGAQPNAISTVPNSISPEAFRSGGDPSILRDEFGWDHDTPVLISAGRIEPIKGHHHLIEIFAKVLERMPHARLLICGRTFNKSSYPDLLRQRVTELGMQHAVVFAGHRYDLPSLMQEANVFSLLSEMEPFGLVFLEAMAVGLPVVTSFSGSVPEIIVHGVTGLISAPDQPGDLVDNLVCLLSNRALAKQMGAAGRQRAAQVFSPDAVSLHWSKTMHRFAQRQASPTSTLPTVL
jgi:glycosyltransferase involved in cell wall biosynthesis